MKQEIIAPEEVGMSSKRLERIRSLEAGSLEIAFRASKACNLT